ncbi:MAG: glycosyltransferase [Chitinophagales bacterium]
MISVLICSANNFFLDQIRNNIAQTIGVEHEILYFDNSKEKKGICAVYNFLASKARFPNLCFVHEDILFATTDWGVIIRDIFSENDDIGVIGIAGSKYKSKLFSGWFSGVKEFDCANIAHQYSYGNELIYLKPGKEKLTEEVVCIDGVFICCRRRIWEQLNYNEEELPGFHFYDIDFSLKASEVCTVCVAYAIDITHITKGGDFGNNWVETAIRFHNLSYDKLPNTKLIAYSAKQEMMIAKTWLDILKKYKISWKNKIKWIKIQRLHFNPVLYYSIAKFLFYRPFGLRLIHKLFRKIR